MEKKKPHYLLSDIQSIVKNRGESAFTATALMGAAALGLSSEQAVAVVLGLKQKDFYKSMTTNADHKILAKRVSRGIEDRLGGVHQSHLARKWNRGYPIQGEMK